ncbi:glutamate ABC transporter substrate-binding protein [Nakamurella flava]|uniref:Glutamate ABC transporter substrate-binding protein n=1 Tax=Nakamurella flava TaxID=2576308 RepID=A0A4U6Q859_9ACTN|nr:glutamate ABC transporter substrate-binding protein [Nakamurella flava]TKV56124.1 glutamate ABC transporter substrate-binding protein [Nakamurella flava]
MRLRMITTAIAGAAAAALALTACGGGGSTAAPGTTSATTAAQSSTSAAASGSDGATSSAGDTGGSAAAGDSKVLSDAASGKLVVGIKFDQPGLGLKNPDGSFSGFDVEVAKYVGQKLGVDPANIEFKESKSAEREGLIERGEVDYIVATYSITDTRKEKVNFAGPYFVAAQDLLVQDSNTDITGPDSLNGKILCSVTGSTPAQKVKDQYSADAALQEFGTYTECVEALRNGAVDAVTTDNVILAGYAAQSPGLKVVGQGFSTENYGIGLQKGDTAGTEAINAALNAMIADGSWEKALQDTVGASGFTLPAPPTPGA